VPRPGKSEFEQLYNAALAQPTERRLEFLREACGGDEELRRELESLLAYDCGPNSLSNASPALMPGQRLGNFEIIGALGKGGMGEVYRARDLRLKRDVAIKTLPSQFADDRNRIARFEREARAASALNHPNIVVVYDVGRENGISFIVSEIVEGETLTRVLEKGPVQLRKLVDIGTQIASALAAAHAAGVIHRDLKPGNVMIGPEGRVKILDFGLASERCSGENSTTLEISSPGVVMGTPGYMAPEQVRGEPADARSDLFSLGVILYEMTAGRPAFRGDSSIERMNSILRDEPAELPDTTPPALDRIIRRCLEKLPTSRFQSASDLGFALGTLSSSAVPAIAPKSRWSLNWKVAILAVLVLAAVSWLGLRLMRQAPAAAFQLRLLSDDGGLAVDGAISPDGKLVAYSSDRANPPTRDIWVQQPSGGSSIRLTDDHTDGTDPAFSPDGTQIAFRSKRGAGGIYVVPTLGGDERELVPGGRHPLFSPDGRWLMYWLIPNGSNYSIYIRPVAGGDPIQIVDDALAPCNSVWSPDGKRIFFQTRCLDNTRDAMVSRVDVKEVKPSNGLARFSGTIEAWLPNPSRLIGWERLGDEYVISAFPISEDGTRSTGPPKRLASVTDKLQHVGAAPDGRLVISTSTAKAHFWGLPLDEQGRVSADARQLTFGSDEVVPVLSPDSKLLMFNSKRINVWRYVVKDLVTGRVRELTTSPISDLLTGAFRPDDTGVICARPDDVLEYIPFSGGLMEKLLDLSKLGVDTPDFHIWDLSPDGRMLLIFAGIDLAHPQYGVVRQLDLKTKSLNIFLDDPELFAWQAHFSPDGRWVIFNATGKSPTSSSSQIYVARFRKGPVSRSEWIPVTHGEWDDKPRFSPDGKRILFVSGRAPADRRIYVQALTPDMRPTGNPVFLYASPNGRRIITDDDISVGRGLVVFSQSDLTGNIYLWEQAKSGNR